MKPSVRLARAQRLLSVQEQMRRLAERDLAATRREVAETEADRARLLETLAGEAMQGLFLDAAARHLRRIAERATELGARVEQQAEAARARALAEKRAERWVEGLARDKREDDAKREALEQLDVLVARGGGNLA